MQKIILLLFVLFFSCVSVKALNAATPAIPTAIEMGLQERSASDCPLAISRLSSTIKGAANIIRSETYVCTRMQTIWLIFKKTSVTECEPEAASTKNARQTWWIAALSPFTNPDFSPLSPRAPPCL